VTRAEREEGLAVYLTMGDTLTRLCRAGLCWDADLFVLGRELCGDGGDGGEVCGRGEEHVAARSCVAAVSGGWCAGATVVCLCLCSGHNHRQMF